MIWHLHTLWSDHHDKSAVVTTICLHKVITILLTVFLMLFFLLAAEISIVWDFHKLFNWSCFNGHLDFFLFYGFAIIVTSWFSSVQLFSCVRFFVTPSAAARQASLSVTNSQSSPKPMSIELVMPSKHLILCHPLLLLPSIFPSIRVFSPESALHTRWPKYWSFSFNISPSSEHSGLWAWVIIKSIMLQTQALQSQSSWCTQ